MRKTLVLLTVFLAACAEIKEPIEGAAQALDDAMAGLERTLGLEPDEPASGPAHEADLEALHDQGLKAQRSGDHETAAALFRQAAMQDHSAAAYELGVAYTEGRGVPVDLDQGADWLDRAAELGEPRALYLLGAAYSAGAGVEQDHEVAAEYLGQAAVRGHARAQYLLAEAFANGLGVPQDLAWAMRWYGKAARQGLPDAQFAYGVAWAGGLVYPKDPVRALTWVSIAARDDYPQAEELRQILARRMSATERARAEAVADSFKPATSRDFADAPTIAYAQYSLNRLGHAAGPVDGVMGHRTRAAIAAYQKRRGLAADARLTPALLERLLEDSRDRA